MNGEPEAIASIILANPDVISKLGKLDRGDLRIELWHVVVEIAGALHQEMPVNFPVPDVKKLTDAVLPLIVVALGKCADTASTT